MYDVCRCAPFPVLDVPTDADVDDDVDDDVVVVDDDDDDDDDDLSDEGTLPIPTAPDCTE